MAGAIKSLIKGRLPGAPGRRRQNVPLTLVHTSSARARPPRCARFWAQPSPRPASCPPCLGCPRVSSRPPLHARRALQGRPRGRALASTGAEGICQACRSRSIRRSQLVGRGAACSGQWAQRVGDHLVAEPDVWLQHRPQRTRRRTAVAPARRGMRRMGGSPQVGVTSGDAPTGPVIREHQTASVGEHCACSRASCWVLVCIM